MFSCFYQTSEITLQSVAKTSIFFGSSLPEVFCKKGVLTNFVKYTGKHLCQRLFFNKVSGLRPETLLKKSLWHRCFPVNFAKFLRTPFLTEHLQWLLLNFIQSVFCLLDIKHNCVKVWVTPNKKFQLRFFIFLFIVFTSKNYKQCD